MKTPSSNVTKAVKTEGAPLVGAPPEYLGDIPRSQNYTLLHPFRLEGVEYRVLTVSRLTGKQISAVSKASREGVDAELAVWAAMCGIPVNAAAALDSQDINNISALGANFTPPSESAASEPTGEDGEPTPQT